MNIRWLLVALFAMTATPLCAADDNEANTEPNQGVFGDDFETGSVADRDLLPLAIGRDRTGWGVTARVSGGYDDNVFKVDRNVDREFFAHATAEAYFGVSLGYVEVGVRGQAAGRLYFGLDDSEVWDLKVGGFVRAPYDYDEGGIGWGVSADGLWQQLHTYEFTSNIARRDDLKVAGAIARAWIGYSISGYIIPEIGITGRFEDVSEEANLNSLDNWRASVDVSVTMRLWLVEIRPYAEAHYSWFRDLYDTDDDGTINVDEDKLQITNFDVGVDARLDLGILEAEGRAYANRQDDGAAGFERYWQYGLRAQARLNIISTVRITGGFHVWTREYTDRETPRPDIATPIERYLSVNAEVAYGFVGMIYVGGRWEFQRRDSDFNNGGFTNHQLTLFVEVSF